MLKVNYLKILRISHRHALSDYKKKKKKKQILRLSDRRRDLSKVYVRVDNVLCTRLTYRS